MKIITLDIYQTLFAAVLSLFLGSLLKKKIQFFEKTCIPAPVIGGTIFSVLNCILHSAGLVEIQSTDTLKEVCMIFFFTSVGFNVNIKFIKTGGKPFLKLILIVFLVVLFQNLIGVVLSLLMKLNPFVGLCAGSVSLIGGHGTSAAFGPELEAAGLTGATTIATAVATFGLIAGSLIGAPLANYLIQKKKLLKKQENTETFHITQTETEETNEANKQTAIFFLVLAAGLGSWLSKLISKTGLIFPSYIGSMLIGVIVCNICLLTKKISMPVKEIDNIGITMLELFLGMALISMKLWQLAELALPIILILAVQTLFLLLFARFFIFNFFGHSYEAAVITSGVIGFGFGATPNAMANIQSVTLNRPFCPTAFMLIPIVGTFFIDLINSLTIVFFMNVFK